MASTEAEVLDQMQAAGIEVRPESLAVDGRLHRFGDKKGKKNSGAGYYRLHEFSADNGERMINGMFGWWGHVESTKVTHTRREFTAEDRARYAREAQARRDAAERQAAQDRAAAADRSRSLWRMASPTGISPYLERKGVRQWAESVRYLADGTLIVPMIRYDKPRAAALVGVQRIAPDGEKRYSKDCERPGSAVRLGRVGEGSPIIVCEGYATGLSIRAATHQAVAVFVAFDAGNLLLTAHVVRKLHPDAHILFAGDDDFATVARKRGQVTNPGITKAWLAARELGNSSICRPVFRSARNVKSDGTDYNDWHLAEGLAMLEQHFERVLAQVQR